MNLIRIALIAITVSAASGTGASAAGIFSPGPNPIPNGSGFRLTTAAPGVCLTPTRCFNEAFIQNLQLAGFSQTAAGGDAQYTATFFAQYTDGGNVNIPLAPGTFFEISIGGGYNPLLGNIIGTFPITLTSASFSGLDSYGTPVDTSLDPNTVSLGNVTISAVPGGFNIDSAYLVNPQGTYNGNPVVIPQFNAVNTPIGGIQAVPEPSSMISLGAIAGFGVISGLKRKLLNKSKSNLE